jgi:adenylate kinase
MTWALTVTSSALTSDDFRKHCPHSNFKTQYEAELKATKLWRENSLIDVYALSCGIPYGAAEDLLFQHFQFAWSLRYNESVGIRTTVESLPLMCDGENVIPMIHVRDIA